MTINVSGPNGVNVSFPDGTDAATINSVMAQHFGGSVPKAPAPGRPWEAYGHVSGPWDEWRSDPVTPKSSGEFWKDDPVVAPQSHPAPPPGFVLDSAASGVPPLPSGFVLDQPSVGGRRSAAPPSKLVPVDHDPWAEFRTADQPSVGGRRSATKTGVTLNIGGQTVTVDESFLKLSPDQQNNTVDEIARSLRAKAQGDWDVVSQKPIGPWDVVAQSPASEQPSVAADIAKSIPGDIVGAVHDIAGVPLYDVYGRLGRRLAQQEICGSRLQREAEPHGPHCADQRRTYGQPRKQPDGEALPATNRAGAISAYGHWICPGGTRGGGNRAKAAALAAPTGAELKAAAQAAYKHPVVKDVEFKPQAVGALSGRIQMDLAKEGFRPVQDNAKSTFAALKDLNPPAGVRSVTVDDLDAARKVLSKYSKQVDAVGAPTTNATAAARAIEKIDDFLPNLQQSDLLRGNAVLASEKLTEARGNWAAYKRSQLADTKMENARIQAASTYGGGNINNALRQAYRPLEVNNYGKVAGWSPEAKAALKDVVEGRTARNIARDIGRNAPTGPVNIGLHLAGGVPAAVATGGASVIPQVAIAAGTYAAKKLAERGTKKAAERLSEVLRSQSPLAQQRALQAPAAPTPRLTPGQQRLMAAALALPGAQRSLPNRPPFSWASRAP